MKVVFVTLVLLALLAPGLDPWDGPAEGPATGCPLASGPPAVPLLGDVPPPGASLPFSRGRMDEPGLVASTFLEGMKDEDVLATALDASGNIYVVGATKSGDMNNSRDAYQRSFNLGLSDALDGFIALASADCSRLMALTYFGGASRDAVTDVQVLDDGDVIVAGFTNSDQYINTTDAYDTSYNRGERDVFLAKLSGDLSQKKYCTYFGGSGFDSVASVALAEDGSVYLTAETNSTDLPVSPDANMTAPPSGGDGKDIIVAHFDRSLWLEHCTYLGGSSEDRTPHCAIGPMGRVVVAFDTHSADVPTSPSAVDRTLDGANDTFVAVLDSNLTTIVSSTYLGGGGFDLMGGLAVDSVGRAYVTGMTDSSDFDTTHDAYYTTRRDVDNFDAYLTVLNSSLDGLAYSTFVGGDGGEGGLDVVLGPEEELVYSVGLIDSTSGFECTAGCYADEFDAWGDLYLFAVNMTDRSLAYASYFGGSGEEQSALPAHIMEVNNDGRVLFGFDTTSDDLAIRDGAYCSTFSGRGRNVAVVHINPVPCPTFDEPDVTCVPGDGHIDVSWNISSYKNCRVKDVVVRRGDTGDDPDGIVFRQPLLDHTFTDTASTVNGVTWYYWVSVVNTMGEGARKTCNATPIGRPTPPRGLEAVSGDGNVTLNWTEPEDWGGRRNLSYRLYRSEDRHVWVRIGGPIDSGKNTTYDTGNLTLGEVYWYAIEARNREFNSTWEMGSVRVFRPPTEPLDLEWYEGNGSLNISWSLPQENGGKDIERYRVYVRIEGGGWQGPVGQPAADRTFRQDVPNYVMYTFRVSAYNGVEGPWNESDPISAYGPPFAPGNLEEEMGIGSINLTWEPPERADGSRVIGYWVRYGPQTDDLEESYTTDLFWHYLPRPGVNYTYQVMAVNDRGERGPPNTTWATAFGLPSAPRNVAAERLPFTILVSWEPPEELGGSTIITYRVQRSVDEGAWETLPSDFTSTKFEEDSANLTGGSVYQYRVQALNPHPSQTTDSDVLRFTRIPGPVQDLEVTVKSGFVLVTWDEPEETGGAPVVEYDIIRTQAGGGTWHLNGSFEGNRYSDPGVDHNQTYSYCVRAKNTLYDQWGEDCPWETIPIVGHLGRVQNLTSSTEDGKPVLNWSEPLVQEFLEVQGYRVYRGLTDRTWRKVAELGVIHTWTDTDPDLERETTYFYWVQAYHAELPGEWGANTTHQLPPKVEEPPSSWTVPLGVLALLILAILAVVAVVVLRRRRAEEVPEEPGEEAPAAPVPPWHAPRVTEPVPEDAGEVPPAAAPAHVATGEGLLPYLVEEVFVVYRDGRLITSCAREECGTQDADLMSGMLIAIQGLIQDGLESGGTLESIKYGENLISLATGESVVLAAVVYGRPDEELQDTLRSLVANVEGIYTGVIEEWTGDPSTFSGLDGLIMPLIERTAVMTRDDVSDVLTARGVSLLSAVDFHRGYVRLKMAAVNATLETIMDAATEVHYDSDMLRLERVEPPTITVRGDRANLGNILPGERKTVGLLFDPQICQSTHLDGHLSYYDSRGELQYKEMKRRNVEVVCPVFFTRENANTAMLRRLIKDRLHMSDLRVYRYPREMDPGDVLALGKQALGSDAIQLVREYIELTPSYEAELWYYAETKAKGYQFVIRLGVVEEKGVLELFAASTAMEPITGLLAEFRRDLDQVLRERFTEEARIEVERDEELRKDLERRPLRLMGSR